MVTPPTSTGSSIAHGIERARPPDANQDLVQARRRRHRRPLEGARPTRLGVQGAELRLLLEGIDLDHDPVDLVVEIDPRRFPLAAPAGDLFDRFEALCVRIRPEAALAQPLKRLRMRSGLHAFADPHAVDPERERSRGRDRRVLLPERSGCRIARVGRQFLVRACELLVQLPEAGERKVDLSSHLDHRRRIVAEHAERNRRDRAEVDGHVLTLDTVSACGAAHEDPVLVGQVDGKPVDLRLDQPGDVLGHRVQALADVLRPLLQLPRRW